MVDVPQTLPSLLAFCGVIRWADLISRAVLLGYAPRRQSNAYNSVAERQTTSRSSYPTSPAGRPVRSTMSTAA
jgi:hypothetical protein